jgi:proteasome lid subunit RPN8/RPN11
LGPELGAGWPVDRLVALAEASPAAEICGLLVGGAGGDVVAWPFANVALTPATAFRFGSQELLGALRRLERSGDQVVAVYHSHLAGGADLSARDLAAALIDDAPVLPGAVQLVVALEGGAARSVRAHRLTGGCFEPVDLWWR